MAYFDELKKLIQFLLKLLGWNILSDNANASNWSYLVALSIFSMLPVLFNYILQNLYLKTFYGITEPICTIIIMVRINGMLFSLVKFGNEWKQIIEEIQSQRKSASQNEHFKELELKNSRSIYRSRVLFVVQVTVAVLIITCYVHQNQLKLPVNFTLPFLALDDEYFWIINFIYQFIVVWLASIAFVVYKCMKYLTLCHCCWNIDNILILFNLLNEIIDDNEEDMSVVKSLKRSKKITKMLMNIHVLHLKVINFHATVQKQIKWMILTEFIVYIFTICLCTYIMAINLFDSTYIVVIFVVNAYQLYEFCCLGRDYEAQIEKLSTALYFLKWYDLKVDQQKYIKSMLQATQNMKSFNGIFAPLNMKTFQGILNSSYSIWKMLWALRNKASN